MTIAKEILSRNLTNNVLDAECFVQCLVMSGGDTGGNVEYIFEDESRIVFDGLIYAEVV
jgi:hypothetical protein